MTLEITEKDKKLLMYAGIGIAIFLLIVLALVPLVQTGNRLETDLAAARTDKQEKELKVSSYPALQNREKEVVGELDSLKASFYGMMRSDEVDRLMTGMALARGVYCESLQIQMPDMEAYARVSSYEQNIGLGQEASEEAAPFDGVYEASVSMSLTGTREALQQLLDDIYAQSGMQMENYSWQENKRETSAPYSLSLTVNLFMAEDVEDYIEKQLAEEAAAAATEAPL